MTMTTTTAPVDLRAAALDKLCQLQDSAAALGLRVEGDPGLLPASALALVLAGAEGACKLLAACQAALPVEGGAEAGEGDADAT